MDMDTMNWVIVFCVVAVTLVALLLALLYFVKDKLCRRCCRRGEYAEVNKKSPNEPPTPRNTPAQPLSSLSRQQKKAIYQPGQKTHDVDGLAFIDDKNAPAAVASSDVVASKV